jgi:hypothetical protein
MITSIVLGTVISACPDGKSGPFSCKWQNILIKVLASQMPSIFGRAWLLSDVGNPPWTSEKTRRAST